MFSEEHFPEPLSDLVARLQFSSQVLGLCAQKGKELPGQPVDDQGI